MAEVRFTTEPGFVHDDLSRGVTQLGRASIGRLGTLIWPRDASLNSRVFGFREIRHLDRAE